MDPWDGKETADIAYDDHGGILTSLFIDKEYLGSEVWEGRRPKYFIEVKSTTKPCNEPFFISKNQYQMVGQIYVLILVPFLVGLHYCVDA
jgi:hypothetical protein